MNNRPSQSGALIDLQKQAVAAAGAAMNAHEGERYSQLFAPDATVNEYGLGEAKGRKAIANAAPCLLCTQSGFMLEHEEGLMKTTESSRDFVVMQALDPEDASAIIPMRTAGRTQKGVRWTIDARKFFDALMEGVSPRDDVTFESATVGDVPGIWVHPASSRSDEAILHVHGGWFSAGSARAYRHLVG